MVLLNGYVFLYIIWLNKEDDLVTDKELKKLSRLELLELLLAESRENERLRAELEEIKQENAVKKSAEQLSETSKQLDETSGKLGDALQQVSLLIENLNKGVCVNVENKSDLSSPDDKKTEEISEVDSEPIVKEITELEKADEIVAEDESDFADKDFEKIFTPDDISRQIDAILQKISLRIKEFDSIADDVTTNSKVSSS